MNAHSALNRSTHESYISQDGRMTLEVRQAVHPLMAKGFDTTALREHFHIGGLFVADQTRLVYSHVDRFVVGGAVPTGAALKLEALKPIGTASFMQRRELGVFNIGGPGTVHVADKAFAMGRLDSLYVGMGAGEVSFTSDDARNPARFYLLSTPAHARHETRLIRQDQAKQIRLGAQETSNLRTIYQVIHPDIMPSCQLVMGFTMLDPGNIWNTMPSHVHDRRSEIYLYFNMAPETRIFHMMGEPQETRHLVMANEEALISPGWSIHSGAGTANYTFCWAHGRGQSGLHRYGHDRHGGPALMSRSPFDLTGRVALVTGANGGIGQAIAVALAAAGADVALVARSDLSQTQGQITALGRRALTLKADLDSTEPVPGLVADTIAWGGRLDYLVNNAGTIRRADAVDFTEEDWDHVMDVNLKSAFFLTQAAGRHMLARGSGKVINIASMLSFQGGIRVASYTAAKSGMAGITKLLANEWAGQGVNVNAIAPGYIATNNTAALQADAVRSGQILARIPAGRWGQPADMGGAAVFLASDAAAYMHGVILRWMAAGWRGELCGRGSFLLSHGAWIGDPVSRVMPLR